MSLAADLAALERFLGSAEAEAPSLEELLTSPRYFALTTATPLQRAICRIADGAPLGPLAQHDHIRSAIGCDFGNHDLGRPDEMCIVSGIRTAKSLLATAAAVRMSQTCDVSRLGPGEEPRVSLISWKMDLAHVVYRHLLGNILEREGLRPLLVKTPTADSVTLRHPSGRHIEVKVVAGAKAGTSLTARWSAGVVFDEAPRMAGQEDGVVNLSDMRQAVIGRLLPGAQIWTIGSPWAPFGPVYDDVTKHWRQPTRRLVVVKAPGPWMNPVWWTPERVESLRTTDPRAYRTDVMAEFADADETFIPTVAIEKCTRRAPLVVPHERGYEYFAAMDPATRSNAWSLVIGTIKRGKRVIVLARQWQGSPVEPLDPFVVLQEIAAVLRVYELGVVETDQWSTDALRVIAQRAQLLLVEDPATAHGNAEMYLEMKRRIEATEVELPPDPVLRADLQRMSRRVTQTGVAVVLPKTGDGRHCDYAPALARVLRRWMDEPEQRPKPGSAEAHQAEARRMFEARLRQVRREDDTPWQLR